MELALILAHEDTISHVRASAHRSLAKNAIPDRQGADKVAHLTTLRELFRSCVALNDKVGVAFGIDRCNRRVLPAQLAFLTFFLRFEEPDMVSHRHANDPFGVWELHANNDRVMIEISD